MRIINSNVFNIINYLYAYIFVTTTLLYFSHICTYKYTDFHVTKTVSNVISIIFVTQLF